MAEPRPIPLVLLHGVGQGPTAWQPVVDVVGTSRAVLAPWLRGLRPGRKEGFELDAAVAAVAQQLELNGHQRVALVGASLGGVVAVRLAATRPELVDRLLLASPTISPPRWVLAAQRGVVALTPRRVFTNQGVTKDSVRTALGAVAALDLRADLGALAIPPLVVVGAQDRSAREAVAEIQRRVPGTIRKEIAGAGQDLLRDAGPEFGRIVGEWLSRG